MIDNSAAMQALTPSGKSRFDIAREKLDADLSVEDGGGEISVYVTAPQPRRIAPPFTTLTEARLALSRIKPTDAPNDQTTLENFLSNLASEARVAKVIFAGANALAAPVPARIHPIAVGDAVANSAIGSFSLRREVLGAEALHASLTIANFSPETRTLELVVTGDGKEVAHAREALGARETATLEFPAIPPARIYKAKLAPDDALALDNVAYATAGSVKNVSILFISPTPADAAGLNSIPGVAVTAKNPDAYSPDELDNFDLAIFEYATPKELPAREHDAGDAAAGRSRFRIDGDADREGRDRRMAHDRHAHRLGEFPAAESARRRVFRDASVDEPGRRRRRRRAAAEGRARRASFRRDRLQSVSVSRQAQPADVGADAQRDQLSRRTGRQQQRLSDRTAVAGAGGRRARDPAVGKKEDRSSRHAVHRRFGAGSL